MNIKFAPNLFFKVRRYLDWAALSVFLTMLSLVAQTPDFHRLTPLTTPDNEVQLLLSGSPASIFQNIYDLFPIDESTNLKDWERVGSVLRTNVTNEVVYTAANQVAATARFFRTPTNHFSTPFPSPTGPFDVGTFSRLLTDESRTNRFKIRTNSSFMVTFWYPTHATVDSRPAPYSDMPLAQSRAYWSTFTNRVPSWVSHAIANSALANRTNPFPVIIYSHGLGDAQGQGVRNENSHRAQELASHGYIIIAADHTDTYATVFPNDHLVLGGNAWSFDFLNDRLKDITFLLNYISQLNLTDPIFQGALDQDRIGIMGWSFGGGTAGEACRLEDRIKAAALLDGYLQSAPLLLNKGLSKPLLAMNSPLAGLASENTALFNKSASPAYQFNIKDAPHDGFTDAPWMIGVSKFSRRRATVIDACVVSFFNKYLKGIDDGLLNDPSTVYSDVQQFRKK